MLRTLAALAVLSASVAHADLLDRVTSGELSRYHHKGDKHITEKRVAMTPELLAEALEVLRTPGNFDNSMAMCFNPHHRLVLRDAANKIVADADICFSCTGIAATPALHLGRGMTHKGVRALRKLYRDANISPDAPDDDDDTLENPFDPK